MNIQRHVWTNRFGRCVIDFSDTGITAFRFRPGKSGEFPVPLYRDARIITVKSVPAEFSPTIERMDNYFSGDRIAFKEKLDYGTATEFQKEVWKATSKIKHSGTTTYAEVARSANRPAAVRAAGSALGANPFLIIVPCHRVLKSDGTLGGFSAGIDLKTALLALEQGDFAPIKKLSK